MQIINVILRIIFFFGPSIIRLFQSRLRNKQKPFNENENFFQQEKYNDEPLVSPELLDAYKTLGINIESSNDEIKKAYHKLALLYHPDRNHSEEAKEKMIKINAAYALIKKEREL